jgi:nucleoside-diphosphate-sugar epimerase
MPAGCSSTTETNAARWLVLGAGGFIGRNLVATLKGEGHIVAEISRSTRPEADILDRASLRVLLREFQPTIILNACGHGATVSGGMEEFYERSTRTLLEAVAEEVPASRVVLLGSAAEYGNTEGAPGAFETDPLRPLSDYGRAKCRQFEVAGEFLARGLAITTARLFNPIGPGQGDQQFVGGLLNRIRRGEGPLRVRDGDCIRDWLDVRDAARAIVMAAGANASLSLVNICSGRGQTVEYIARAVARMMNVDIEVEPARPGPTLLARSVGNPARLFSLGWRPQYDLAQTLADQCRHEAKN